MDQSIVKVSMESKKETMLPFVFHDPHTGNQVGE